MPNLFILTAVCLTLFSGSTPAPINQVAPENAVVTQVVTGHNGRHSYVLRIVAGPFRRTRHHLCVVPHMNENEEPDYWMDGKPESRPNTKFLPNKASPSQFYNWFGTDGGFPNTEFYSFDVKVDGKSWKFPKRLWQNCYEPNLSADPKEQNPNGRLSKDGKRLTIDCYAGDGGGSYWVRWHLRKDGRATRDLHWPRAEERS